MFPTASIRPKIWRINAEFFNEIDPVRSLKSPKSCHSIVRELYDKFVGFVENLTQLGIRIALNMSTPARN
jgi:hypothetical protein